MLHCLKGDLNEVEFLSTASSLGAVPTLIFLLCIVGAFLIWTIRMMSVISRSVKKLEDDTKAKDKEQDDRIAHLQQHYVTKEDMFQQFGGWRAEINKVSDQILHLTELIARGRSDHGA